MSPRHAGTLAAAIALAIGLAASSSTYAQDPNELQVASHVGVIVRYRDAAAMRDTRTLQARAESLIAGAKSRASVAGVRVAHVRRGAFGDVLRFGQPIGAQEMARLLRELAADPRVAAVEPDLRLMHTGIAAAASAPNDPGFDKQWHFTDPVGGINLPDAWALGTGTGKVVAVVDSGYVPHADMAANVLPGYDFITDPWTSRRASSERVPGGYDLGDWSNPGECYVKGRDSSWHGTHVAGTIAQVTDNTLMGAGVAHGAKVVPVRVIGRCGGDLSDIVDGVVWAAGGDVPGVPRNDHPADVINMSLGGVGSCATGGAMQNAIDFASSRGSIVVVAAGNSYSNVDYFFPANCAQTITVGATTLQGAQAGYSNFGVGIDIAAPGGNGVETEGDTSYIWQAVNASKTSPTEDAFEGMAGTSMAAPHVAGIVALMLAAAPERMTTQTVNFLLQGAVRPFGIEPTLPLGPGIIDASQAVQHAKEADPCVMPAGCIPANAWPVTDRVAVKVEAGSGETLSAGPIYRFEVPANATLASFRLFGGTGDATLLIRHGAEPMANAFDQRSARAGSNTESLSVRFPRPGVWYAKVVGAHAGASLHARVD